MPEAQRCRRLSRALSLACAHAVQAFLCVSDASKLFAHCIVVVISRTALRGRFSVALLFHCVSSCMFFCLYETHQCAHSRCVTIASICISQTAHTRLM
jgi:hypothetical protein